MRPVFHQDRIMPWQGKSRTVPLVDHLMEHGSQASLPYFQRSMQLKFLSKHSKEWYIWIGDLCWGSTTWRLPLLSLRFIHHPLLPQLFHQSALNYEYMVSLAGRVKHKKPRDRLLERTQNTALEICLKGRRQECCQKLRIPYRMTRKARSKNLCFLRVRSQRCNYQRLAELHLNQTHSLVKWLRWLDKQNHLLVKRCRYLGTLLYMQEAIVRQWKERSIMQSKPYFLLLHISSWWTHRKYFQFLVQYKQMSLICYPKYHTHHHQKVCFKHFMLYIMLYTYRGSTPNRGVLW